MLRNFQVRTLDDSLLDAAVAQAEGWDVALSSLRPKFYETTGGERVAVGECFRSGSGEASRYNPSNDARIAYMIIKREGISVVKSARWWEAYKVHGDVSTGTTPLIAAMRCYVHLKWGNVVVLNTPD